MSKVVSILLVVGLFLSACGSDINTGEFLGVTVEPPQEKATFVLTDTEGNAYDFASETDGRLTLLYFGYLNCPDICPVHLAQIAEVFDQNPALGRESTVVFVSVDPDRDSPEKIREFLDNFDTRFVGLVGTQEEVEAAQDAFNIPHAQKVGDGDNYTVNHAGWVTAFAPDNLSYSIYPFGTRQSQWSNDLQLLAGIQPVASPAND
ncbi:MAG: SCO family protein [Actinomycetota bacterium]|nr:SCO family protein [Actinomycetota bacterium]